LNKGYEVHGITRRSSSFNTGRIDHIYQDPHSSDAKMFLHFGDMTDGVGIANLVAELNPDEIYNLAAQSQVRVSFDIPEYTENVVGLGTVRILEAIRHINPQIKYYQASSSEIFGDSPPPQNENTCMRPNSPYSVAKLCAYWNTVNYRTGYGLFACNGILFNHESPRRGETFVTRKITMAAARIKLGLQKYLFLGNMEAKRDWGYSKDYVIAMWQMMQMDKSEDIVIGTGETHTVREFVEEAFSYVDLDYRQYIKIDPKYYRPNEVNFLQADIAKAKRLLNWEPKVKFKELVHLMMDADMEYCKN
jgi:GDPmannose 4,6-dehydratase